MMTFLIAVCVLVFILQAVAEPMRHGVRDDPPASTSPVTVTVTVTASLSSIPDVVITRTITRSSWTTTTVAVVNLNCTQQVYAPLPTVSPTSLPLSSAGQQKVRRQASETSTNSTAITSAIATLPGLTSQRGRTRTTYLYTTATQSDPFTRTRYQCAATIAYAFTVDTTATVSYTQTRYQSTAVSTSTIVCPGVGGFPFGYTGSAGLPAPTASTTQGYLQERQTTAPLPITSSLVSSLAGLGTLTTVTVHQTRTAYTIVTLSVTDLTTNVRYACSTLPFDVSVTYPVTRTTWPSTTTIVSYLNCGRAPLPSITPRSIELEDGMAMAGRPKRQASESSTTASTELSSQPQSQSIHRTTYVPSTVTITASTDSTRLIYSCTPTPSSSLPVPSSPSPSPN